jgi:hypothetical protein
MKQPCPPNFTQVGLLDFIVELVVSEDNVRTFSILEKSSVINNNYLKAIQFIDKPAFRNLLLYARPSLQDSDIPHRTKFRKEILARAKAVEARVRDKLQVCLLTLLFQRWDSCLH